MWEGHQSRCGKVIRAGQGLWVQPSRLAWSTGKHGEGKRDSFIAASDCMDRADARVLSVNLARQMY